MPEPRVSNAPRDNEAYRFPVSVKGVVMRERAVLLVRNSRDEWELPGGKLELNESPEACVAREIEEEVGLTVAADVLLDSWVYSVAPGVHVLVLTYGCIESPASRATQPVISHEHTELCWSPLPALHSLTMPQEYRTSIRAWAMRTHADASQDG
ncbi:MAG: NUDIX hydrolase [Gemmatimonadaceae bacterium]